MEEKTIINTLEIEKLFKEYCKENKVEFSEIDFYDWVKDNLKQWEKSY